MPYIQKPLHAFRAARCDFKVLKGILVHRNFHILLPFLWPFISDVLAMSAFPFPVLSFEMMKKFQIYQFMTHKS